MREGRSRTQKPISHLNICVATPAEIPVLIASTIMNTKSDITLFLQVLNLIVHCAGREADAASSAGLWSLCGIVSFITFSMRVLLRVPWKNAAQES